MRPHDTMADIRAGKVDLAALSAAAYAAES